MKLMLDASFPQREAAIKAGGDGIQLQLELPESDAKHLPELLKFKGESFKIVLLTKGELEEDE
ncbi:unnamed protein product [marine sediment metagenome]|uniref:Uncharacterized protein n=1 Tax=marine sediment metagenome TaxID=412755 RepID=X1FCB8_9ZZZZ